MATDIYVNSTLEAGGRVLIGGSYPATILKAYGTYEKTAADTNASVLRLLKGLPITAIPLYHESKLNNDALTGATDVDLGIYKTNHGDVIDKDLLTDGIDIAAGNALASAIQAFQTHPSIDQFGLTLKALAEATLSTTLYDQQVDVALTGNTFGTATGTISWNLAFLLPQG